MSTETNAMHASVTSLTYPQLSTAMADSAAEQETRMARFLAAADLAVNEPSPENTAGMNGIWAGYKAQAAMSRAIAEELAARIKARNYA